MFYREMCQLLVAGHLNHTKKLQLKKISSKCVATFWGSESKRFTTCICCHAQFSAESVKDAANQQRITFDNP